MKQEHQKEMALLRSQMKAVQESNVALQAASKVHNHHDASESSDSLNVAHEDEDRGEEPSSSEGSLAPDVQGNNRHTPLKHAEIIARHDRSEEEESTTEVEDGHQWNPGTATWQCTSVSTSSDACASETSQVKQRLIKESRDTETLTREDKEAMVLARKVYHILPPNCRRRSSITAEMEEAIACENKTDTLDGEPFGRSARRRGINGHCSEIHNDWVKSDRKEIFQRCIEDARCLECMNHRGYVAQVSPPPLPPQSSSLFTQMF